MATRKIAILTSGGDAPGMNAAIRAAARTGIAKGWEIFGVRDGYAGLVAGADRAARRARRRRHPGQRGGTFLGSARLREFKDEPVRARGLANLRARGIDGLVVIGGNGSQSGALALSQMGLEVVGVASTIDNDLAGSEITIGVDTALNIALEAIDRLKVTASSHKRAFLVEVMGRNCGYLALMAGIAGGAESVVIPEAEVEPEVIVARHPERLRARQGARAGGRRGGRAQQRRRAWRSTSTAHKEQLGLRPARDDAGSRPARRHARRLRSPAGDPARGGGRRAPGARRARAPDGPACRARCARRR